MLTDFYIIPLFATTANIGCLILNLGRDHPFQRLMVCFYAAVSVLNLTTALLFLSGSENAILNIWRFASAPAWFLLAPVVVGIAAFTTGRRILSSPTLATGLAAFLAFLVVILFPEFYFVGYQEREFGFGPRISGWGSLLAGLPQMVGIIMTLYVLARPVQLSTFFSRPIMAGAFLLWWLPLFSNLVSTSGVHIPPLHPIADTAMSVILSMYLNRFSVGPGFALRLTSNLLISASLGLMLVFFWPTLKTMQQGHLILCAGATVVACGFLSLLIYRQESALGSESVSFGPSLSVYGLSRQEIRICELLYEGHSRSFIQIILNVSNGTLRNHLKNIYSKVPMGKGAPGRTKDQLQRLTVFLSREGAKRGPSHAVPDHTKG